MAMHKEKAQAAVELVILLPVLLLFLLGSLDLGRAFSVWLTLANGSREGARYGCLYPTDIAGITAQTKADILADGLSDGVLRVQVSTPKRDINNLPVPGSPVVVTALYTLPMTTMYLFGGQPLSIRASTQMMILGGS